VSGSRRVVATTVVSAAPTAVLAQFTEVEAMQRWWSVARGLVDARVGGIWAVGWNLSPAGYGYVETGVITRLVPDAELRIENLTYFHPARSVLGPMTLRVSVRPAKAGTELRVEQAGYQSGDDWDWYYAAVSAAWPIAIDAVRRDAEAK
jgi:uncharacterized protein YndB with AHSA1/START domain